MALTIDLIDESGNVLEEIYDPPGFADILPSYTDESSQCLRFIDPYGDTVFNTLQIPTFLRELAHVEEGTTVEQYRQFIAELRRLASRCRDETHLYLKFLGD
jgi:hypothetical protein